MALKSSPLQYKAPSQDEQFYNCTNNQPGTWIRKYIDQDLAHDHKCARHNDEKPPAYG
jgi:hypothetical protein